MTESEYFAKLEELDRLLNDPTTPIKASRVWALLADLSSHPTTVPQMHSEFPR